MTLFAQLEKFHAHEASLIGNMVYICVIPVLFIPHSNAYILILEATERRAATL